MVYVVHREKELRDTIICCFGFLGDGGFLGCKQAARAWSPSVCESQWGAGKNEFMTKSFLQKIM